jgi:hypothetical protein
MRTGIYVYSSTTLTVQSTESVVLTSFTNQEIALDNDSKANVGPGIYKVVTNSGITVSGGGVDVVVVAIPNNKDPWPDPPLAALTAFNTTTGAVRSFFAIPDAKDTAF